LVNVNASPLRCILRWKRIKAMDIKELQRVCYAAEMCPKYMITGLSIRWLLVRVPSPSLMTDDARRCLAMAQALGSQGLCRFQRLLFSLPFAATKCHEMP